jgi:hypothetical protein
VSHGCALCNPKASGRDTEYGLDRRAACGAHTGRLMCVRAMDGTRHRLGFPHR